LPFFRALKCIIDHLCRIDWLDVDQIANDIGMSRQMVERYMRFRDQMEAAGMDKRV
jgi:hypothetical protein